MPVVESQVQSEFDLMREQLSGVEQYAMRYLEAERADVATEELRVAEVCPHGPTLFHCNISNLSLSSSFHLSPLSTSLCRRIFSWPRRTGS